MKTYATGLKTGACLLLALFLGSGAGSAFARDPDARICGAYTYIPPKGYKSTEIIYDEPKGSVFINNVPWVRTADDFKDPSVNCILIKNNGDYSYKFETQREIRYRTLAKHDGFLSVAGQCNGDFGKYKVYLLSRKETPPRGKKYLYRIFAIEINEDGNEFDTVFGIDAFKYTYNPNYIDDHDQINERMTKDMCALARQFIGTVKRR